jgi:hypothetical protein
MQLELYMSLILALPEEDLSHIEETDDKDAKCVSLAWQGSHEPLGELWSLQTSGSLEEPSRISARY